jgi:hypothetical protein
MRQKGRLRLAARLKPCPSYKQVFLEVVFSAVAPARTLDRKVVV